MRVSVQTAKPGNENNQPRRSSDEVKGPRANAKERSKWADQEEKEKPRGAGAEKERRGKGAKSPLARSSEPAKPSSSSTKAERHPEGERPPFEGRAKQNMPSQATSSERGAKSAPCSIERAAAQLELNWGGAPPTWRRPLIKNNPAKALRARQGGQQGRMCPLCRLVRSTRSHTTRPAKHRTSGGVAVWAVKTGSSHHELTRRSLADAREPPERPRC